MFCKEMEKGWLSSGISFDQAKQTHVRGKSWGFLECSDRWGCSISLRLGLEQGASNNTHYIIVCSLKHCHVPHPTPWYCWTSFSSSAGLSPGLCLQSIAELLRVCSSYKNNARGCLTHTELNFPCLVLVAMSFVYRADEFFLLISSFSGFWLGNWGASSHLNKNTVRAWWDLSSC